MSNPLDNQFANITINIDAAQRATILAALLNYQENGMGDPENRPLHIHACATALDEQISLDEHGIADLFARIAIAPPPVADRVSTLQFIPIHDQTEPFPSLTLLFPPKLRRS